MESWNNVTGMLTIDGAEYPTNYLTDKTFLANLDQMFGTKVSFYVPENAGYQPVLLVKYFEAKVGLFDHYDPLSNTAFIGGQEYSVDTAACFPDNNSFHGKDVFFLLEGGKVIYIDALEAVKPDLLVRVTNPTEYVYYENNKLSNTQLR